MPSRGFVVLFIAAVLILSASIVSAGWLVAHAITGLCGPQTGGCIVGGS